MPLRSTVSVVCLYLAANLPSVTMAGGNALRFGRDIRPILSDTCFKCHGPAKQEGGLRLDVVEWATQPAGSGRTAVVPGQPDASELLRRILSVDDDERMPPPDSSPQLTDEQRVRLRRWIEQGAPFEKHWSFEVPVRPAVPEIRAHGYRIANPIDAFIAERLLSEQLPMSPEAGRELLVRRVAFAVTGLPPTVEEVDAYLADRDPNAYEKMVDRYLNSARYGEEMARHWLDVARYADTHGLHLDNERQIWPYRDWVVKSFNRNQPFDQFTVEQLAGDLLPAATVDQTIATGFNRCNVTTSEGGSIDEEWVFRNALDRTTTVAQTWLGLTAGCCVCHEHKYDPLTARDYYSLYAFFYSAADPAMDGNALLTAPTMKLPSPQHEKKLAELDARIRGVREELADRAVGLSYLDPATQDPVPPVESVEEVWFDDAFPPEGRVTASPGEPTMLVTAETGQVLSGTRAVRRSDPGLAQDVIEGVAPRGIPTDARLFAHVWIDGASPPRAIMLQYYQGGWKHRAVWGDVDAIAWGKRNSPERFPAGPLPQPGQWVRLEIEARHLGLHAGDAITGFALTQFGGTVYWDKVGISGVSDPANDPLRSLTAFRRQQQGKDTAGAPPDVNRWLKAGPDAPLSDDQWRKVRDYYLQFVCRATKPQFAALHSQLEQLMRERNETDQAIPASFVFRDRETPRDTFVMLRGQYNQPGEKVVPDVPSILPPLVKENADARTTRLDLARWLVSPAQPLTSRVTVNRFWQQLYGVGLVKTSYDFGSQGELPSHPELLDWLAVEFQESGWDVKRLVRLMLTSATFRQHSAVSSELAQRDPANRLYARGPRFRLDAEPLRDNALFVSGLMSFEMGGRGVRPYQPPNIWEPVGFVGSNTARYEPQKGAALYRRSLYTFLKRTAPPPFMSNFDAPNREQFCTVRERSNTPLQALQLMNDVQHFEAARALAERILLEGGQTLQDRIAFGYRVVLSRRPTADEAAIVERLLVQERTRYDADSAAARDAVRNGESALRGGVTDAELAAWTLAANLLLNLDETLTRN